MKKWMTYSIALALTCALWGGQDAQAAGPVFVDENADGIDDNVRISYHRGRKGVLGQRGTSSQLTEEQHEELKTLVDGLKESDTSNEDIRAAVKAKMEEWGIEFPERPAISPGLANLLSEDQQTVLTALIESLRATDTSREDIRAAVDAQLEAWSIERPERGLDALLTEEQETALQTLVEGLRAAETSREDIRAAVNAQLEEWGVERPERLRGGMRGHGGKRGGHGQRVGHRGRGHKPPSESTNSG